MGCGQFHLTQTQDENRPSDLRLEELWFIYPGETGFRLDKGTRAIPRFSRIDPHALAMRAKPALTSG